LADHWKVFNKKNPPSSIILAPGFKEKPDAYIEPENSCIVQVRDYWRCPAKVTKDVSLLFSTKDLCLSV
jgi:hypothetical protein